MLSLAPMSPAEAVQFDPRQVRRRVDAAQRRALRRAVTIAAGLMAVLMGVDLAHANICRADLSTAEDLTEEQLSEAQGDVETKLPEDVHPPQNWVAKSPKSRTANKSR